MYLVGGRTPREEIIMASISKSVRALVCAAIFITFGVPAEAGKPTKPGGGGGDTPNPCTAAGLTFPAFSYVVPRYSKTTGYENEVRLSDADGACSILVQVVASDTIPPDFAPILIAHDQGWRLVWSSTQVGITVLDFTVTLATDQPPVVVYENTATISLAGQRATNFEEMPDGGFIYLARPGSPGSLADSIWRARNDGDNGWTTTKLANINVNVRAVTEIAAALDGNTLYYAGLGDTRDIMQLALDDLTPELPVEIGTQDDPSERLVAVPYDVFGAVVNLAAGPCEGISGQTCLAMELHGPNTDPCVPTYYRTLVWDVAASSTTNLATLEKIQLAKPSFTSAGELIGQLTGSSSKRSCTAKIYDTMIRQSPFSPYTVTTLGTGQVPDAPF
jgi:hypothetical protein